MVEKQENEEFDEEEYNRLRIELAKQRELKKQMKSESQKIREQMTEEAELLYKKLEQKLNKEQIKSLAWKLYAICKEKVNNSKKK